ncbi:MAG: ribosomal RNA small subunit methyltransferase A [Planctomycetaceae bacterium]|nr:ribosomal RNA small subunit methyltransferase A [Planctomycetaceae bacterium]
MDQPERQTRSRLMQLFNEQGYHPRHDLGQNFLIDLNLLEIVVQSASLAPSDVVLEVGTGTGGMTNFLADQAGYVISVEIDPRVHSLARESTADRTNVTLLNCDILKSKNQLQPAVLDELHSRLAAIPDSRLKLVANLPYSVATPVISNLIASELPWELMVVTIQWELALRMQAGPHSADYSALSVWLQSQCQVELLKRLPPTVFWPRPKVDSAIVRITPDLPRASRIADRQFFQEFIRRIFTQRRKHLCGVLASEYRKRIPRERIESVLLAESSDPNVRAEELSPDQLVRIASAIQTELATDPQPSDNQIPAQPD